ncbi:histidinol-phosphate transaminase [Marinivivus vitaminiproducens]|uniref:histidinol-phosphate transaminase n=1 Tax=Marinivivus vitaminiproducens TaxID=3035935 RepID=UPI00279A88DA|nr:histidinol-phosphate transaminase [Geminicoccaceae bacterium SCSIO 64248]
MSALRPKSGILEISAYVGGKSGDGTSNVIKLSSNENPLGASPKAIAAYRDVAGALQLYPDGGAVTLREAIGARYDLDPARLVCGAGSDELLALLVRAYAGPGDEVLYSAHGFMMYRISTLAAGATPVTAPERLLTTDVDAMLAAVTTRTRIVFVANPNNPTGSYISDAEMRRLHAGLPEDVLLVIDAAYAEYVRRADYGDGNALVDEAANVVTTRTFSKIHGLAGLRLGWMYAQPEVVDVINRTRGPFNVGSPSLAAGVAAIGDVEHEARSVEHNDRWLVWLSQELTESGLVVHPSVGNFLLVTFPEEEGQDAAAASRYLESQGILARAMDGYGLGHSLRITIGTESDNRAVAKALAEFVR